MTTVVNQPAPANDSSNPNNMLNTVLALLLILGIVYVFFVYALPALRDAGSGGGGVSAPQINVPDKIDVDVNQPNIQPSQ